ncbi:caspase family protein [Streptomyces sp. SID1121]|uniref:caspase family protein n=1 Tax=Streptomyces sp. SID1121 TaxID=3425888 RepID=UPI004055BE37
MRYFVAAGTRHYPEDPELLLAHDDVSKAAELFASMGYERILSAVSYDPDSQGFQNALADWCGTADLTADDSVVVYYAGHGDRSPSGEYRLACASSVRGRPGSWLSLSNLAEILATSPVRNVLFIVDACHAAAATAEIGPITNAIVAGRGRTDSFGSGTWLLASARHRDLAVDGAFVSEMAKAREKGEGPSQRYLAPGVIADRVNRSFIAAGLAQRSACSSVDQSESPPFFDNPLFDPRAEVADDGRLRGEASDFSSHFAPRGRGVEHVHDEGFYFTGRGRALREARAHLTGRGRGDLLVVTADPGSGKSAVLGRLVLEGCADASVNAHHQTLEALVGRLAAAADIRAATPDALFTALADRERPFRIVVDSLDEAGPGGDKAEARRIAWELLRPLAAVSCVRLLVGSRRELLPHLGDRVPVVDLDDDVYTEDTDPAEYVEKILCDKGAPYTLCPDDARLIAQEVARRAGRCFLVARMTASALLRGPVVDVTLPGWAEQLPSDVGGAFETYLQRVPAGRHTATMALLTALAFGEGDGLPRRIWVRVAARLSGIALAEADVDTLLEEDGSYLARARVNGTWYFRLYHQELTDHIKGRVLRRRDAADIQECFVDTLLALVPEHDWSRAHPYVRAHLATHAAGAGVLDDLIEDAAFVIAVDPSTLLPAVRHALRRTTLSMAVERYTYLLVDEDHRRLDRASLLAFVAQTYGEHPLARKAELLSSSVERVCVEPREITPHRVVGRHVGEAYSIRSMNPNWLTEDVVLPDGRRTVLAVPPAAPHVHVWLIDTPAQSTLLPHPARVIGLALLAGDARRAEAVTLDAEGTLRWWDVADQTLSRAVPGTGWTSLFGAGFLSDGTAVLACGTGERVTALSLPGLEPLAEADCPTKEGSRWDSPVTGSACLGVDAEGRAHLLVCDGVRGRVALHGLEEPGEPVVVLDGLATPVLVDHIRGPRGTVAAINEPWSRLSLIEVGTLKTVSTPFHGSDWHVGGFAYGSTDEPVLAAASDTLVTAWIDAPPRHLDGVRVGHLVAPFLHDGRLFATVIGIGSHLAVVDCATGEIVGAPLRGHEGAVCVVRPLPPAPGADGPDILAIGNDGTARLWAWGAHERGSAVTPRGGKTTEATLGEIEALVPWSHEPNSVIAVADGSVRRVVPDFSDAVRPAPVQEPVPGLRFDYRPNVHDRVEDLDGTLNLLSWQYTGHITPEITSGLPGYSASIPVATCVWHRLRPDGSSENTDLRWLNGDVHDRLRGWLLPPTQDRPRGRFVGFDGMLSRVRVLDAPDVTGEWAALPWSVDPARDFVCAAAFTAVSGDTVLMAAARPMLTGESSVDSRYVDDLPAVEPAVTPARLWNVTKRTWHPGDGIPLIPGVRHLLPHHGPDGTRWVSQRGRDGSASVIDIESSRQYTVCAADKAGHLGSGTIAVVAECWTQLPDGTPVLLSQVPAAHAAAGRGPMAMAMPLPVLVWSASAPDRTVRLALSASRILWAGPAPNGEALVAVSDEHGVALCHLPSGERVWYAPLPARVTALTPLPGSPALDLAVGTQQGVVFLRPRLSRWWRDSLGIS